MIRVLGYGERRRNASKAGDSASVDECNREKCLRGANVRAPVARIWRACTEAQGLAETNHSLLARRTLPAPEAANQRLLAATWSTWDLPETAATQAHLQAALSRLSRQTTLVVQVDLPEEAHAPDDAFDGAVREHDDLARGRSARHASPGAGSDRSRDAFAIEQPPDVDVGEVVVRPTAQS